MAIAPPTGQLFPLRAEFFHPDSTSTQKENIKGQSKLL